MDKKSIALPTYTDKQKWFIFMAECLGVRLYKKYYPGGGSYWNKTHFNKKNKKHLSTIIEASEQSFETHFRSIFSEQFVFVPLLLISTYQNGLQGAIGMLILIAFMLTYHLYGMMVHTYNIYRAKYGIKMIDYENKDKTIEEIEEMKKIDKKSEIIFNNEESSMISLLKTLVNLSSNLTNITIRTEEKVNSLSDRNESDQNERVKNLTHGQIHLPQINATIKLYELIMFDFDLPTNFYFESESSAEFCHDELSKMMPNEIANIISQPAESVIFYKKCIEKFHESNKVVQNSS